MKVVAISGWKRSGKDTVAGQLIETEGFKRVAFADPLKDSVAREYSIPREHCDDPAFKEAPILHLPLSPKDAFSLGLSKMMFKECRSEDGKTPFDFHVDPSGAFMGIVGYDTAFTEREAVKQLYWTPRALCILKGSVNRTVRSDFWVQAAINSIKGQAEPMHKIDFDGHKNFVISDLRYQSEVNQLRQAFGKDLITVRVNRFETCNSQNASERDLDNGTFDVIIDNTASLEELQLKVQQLVKERLNG
jgi:hypothetical protein